MPQATQGTKRSSSQKSPVRTFVLDTSVLLSDPGALRRFAEHEVVLPVVVITELEAKRHHPELGFFARSALRAHSAFRTGLAGSGKKCGAWWNAFECVRPMKP